MSGDEKPASVWKKEISFRRKPAEREAEPAAAPESAESTTKSASKSVWKKEVSLRKKTKAAAPEPDVAADEQQPETLPELELALALEAVLLEPELDRVPEPAPEPEPPAVLEIEHSWLTKPLEEVSEAPEPEAEPTQAVTEIEALDPVVAGEVLAEVTGVAETPAEVTPVPELDRGGDLELPELADVDLLDLSDLLDLPELPAEALPDLDAESTQARRAAEASARVPFYKRDLSRKRAPRERKPKIERPKRERVPKADTGGSVPFYRRELSLKRRPKQWDAAEPPSEPKPKRASRFKLELKKSKSSPAAEPTAASPSKPKSRGLARPTLPRMPRLKPSLGGGAAANKLVGLKIGASQIAAARVNNGDSPELMQAVRTPLEHGIVVGGELRDPEALAVALKAFFAEHKLPKRGVRLGIANNRIGVRTFEIAGIDDPKQLENAIRFHAQEVLPIPVEEAVLDFQVLSESVNDEGQPVRRVLLVVAYRELVDRYVYACQKAGLQLVGVDLEAFALLRAIAAPHDAVPGSERAALVAVSVGHDRSNFAVSDGRVCEFTRVLEWGGWALNVAIARALDMSPSEAEPIKRALSLSGSVAAAEGFTEDQLTTAREAAKRQLQVFARELVSSLQFYQNQPGSLGIGEIALTGGTAHLPGLGVELQQLIGVPVRVADPLARLKMSNKVREQDQVGSLAVAIGLGIDD